MVGDQGGIPMQTSSIKLGSKLVRRKTSLKSALSSSSGVEFLKPEVDIIGKFLLSGDIKTPHE